MTEFERGVRAAADVLDGIQGSTGIREAQRLILALLPPVAPAGDLVCDCQQWPTHVSNECPVHNLLPDAPPESVAPAGDLDAEHPAISEYLAAKESAYAPAGDREAAPLGYVSDDALHYIGQGASTKCCINQWRDDHFKTPVYLRPAKPAEERAVVGALETCQRVFGFDLKRMITFGDDYNQAVRDAYDKVLAALSRARAGSEAQNG